MSAIVLTLALLCGQSPSELQERAEERFRDGVRRLRAREKSRDAFLAAVADYEALRRRGAANAALARTVGNAHLLAGDLPRAILTYRLGLRLEPRDAALGRALEAARDRVAYAEGGLGHPPEERVRLGSGPAFGAAAAAWAAACLLFTRWYMTRDRWLLIAAGGGVVAALAAAALLLRGEPPPRPVVVIAADGTPLRRGDGPTFPPRYESPLNRGVEAEAVYRKGDWLLIELAGGERGWVPESAVVGEEQ